MFRTFVLSLLVVLFFGCLVNAQDGFRNNRQQAPPPANQQQQRPQSKPETPQSPQPRPNPDGAAGQGAPVPSSQTNPNGAALASGPTPQTQVKQAVAAALQAEKPAIPPAPVPIHPVPPAKEEVVTDKWCDVIISEDDTKKVILLDQNGEYIPGVRQINVWVEVDSVSPVVRAVSWRGLFKPTTPKIEDWKVRKLRTVSAEEFQRIVDQFEA